MANNSMQNPGTPTTKGMQLSNKGELPPNYNAGSINMDPPLPNMEGMVPVQ